MELDRVTTRINKLTEMMKWAGLYDDSMPDVEKLLDLGYLSDGQFEPLKGAAAWRDVGGIESALFSIPLDKIAAALAQHDLYARSIVVDLQRGVVESHVLRGAPARGRARGRHI